MARVGSQRRKKTKHICILYADQERENGIPYTCTLRVVLTLLHAAAITELQIMFVTVVVKQTVWIFRNGLQLHLYTWQIH
jgi:hypothetical protein